MSAPGDCVVSAQTSPHWAYARACELTGFPVPSDYVRKATYGPALEAFARYIAEHEEAPVDPCVVAGRALVAETQHDWPDSPWHLNEASETLAGNRDYTLVVKAAIEGVRRGIEIGRGEA